MRFPILLAAAALLCAGCSLGAAPDSSKPPVQRVVLLTGFEPFGGAEINASWEAVRSFDGREVAGCRIVARQLPVVWGRPMEILPKLLDEHRPAAVFAFGQGWPGRITFERVGRNARKPFEDNRGRRPERPEAVPGGPAQLVSPFPPERILPALERAGLPVKVSEDAGQYLCDEAVYALEHLRRARGGFECAFFHVPPLDSALTVYGQEARSDRDVMKRFVETLIAAWASPPPPRDTEEPRT